MKTPVAPHLPTPFASKLEKDGKGEGQEEGRGEREGHKKARNIRGQVVEINLDPQVPPSIAKVTRERRGRRAGWVEN